jgi:NhaP-type Na+/H+ or K+/H+ antiporter
MQPPVRLEKFSDEEKTRLRSFLGRRLLLFSGIYGGVIAVSLSFMIFFNVYSDKYPILDHLEIINVAFIVISVLCGRLLVSEIIEFRKEMNAEEKRVIQTRIMGLKDGKIGLGNKSFYEEDFLFGADDFDLLKAGDNVEIQISAKSDMLFRIKRI